MSVIPTIKNTTLVIINNYSCLEFDIFTSLFLLFYLFFFFLQQKGVFVIVVSVSSPTNMHVLAQIAGSSSKVINGNALESTILDEKKVLGVC